MIRKFSRYKDKRQTHDLETKLSFTPYTLKDIKQFLIFFIFCLFPASFDNKISTAHQHHTNSIHHQHNNHHSPNRRSFRNKQNTTNSSNFHHAFHDRQRASHRALFGGGPKQSSHNPKNGGGNSHNAFNPKKCNEGVNTL